MKSRLRNIRRKIKWLSLVLIWCLPALIVLFRAGFSHVRLFKVNRWHEGYLYFTAIKDKKKHFVKVDVKLKLISNDVLFYNIFYKELKEYLIPITDFKQSGVIHYAAFEFVVGEELEEKHLVNNINYIEDIKKILFSFHDKKVIHRDLKLDNFIVESNGLLKIIDFTFVIGLGSYKFKELDVRSYKNCQILAGLGAGLNPNAFSWDDNYSIYKVISEFNPDENSALSNYKKYFYERIGVMNYSIKPKSVYYTFKVAIRSKLKKTKIGRLL